MDRVAELRERLRIVRQQAERARRLALHLGDRADRERMLDYVVELEQRCSDLEQQMAPTSHKPGDRQQIQQQVQQQQGKDKKGGKDG